MLLPNFNFKWPWQRPRGNRTVRSIGVEVIDHPVAFVDVAKRARPFTTFDGAAPAPIDSSGWPLCDGQVVLFDYRPIPAWQPPIDDPAAFRPDMSGRYLLSFLGQARLTSAGAAGIRIARVRHDSRANRTEAEIHIPRGVSPLLILRFNDTRRSPAHPENSGITGLRCIRPGYPADASGRFDARFIDLLRPFQPLRFMIWTGTNADFGGAPLAWADRVLPTDAAQDFGSALRPGAHGVAWEYVVELANAVHRDIWINVPVNATGEDPADDFSYVHRLAQLLKQGLDPELHIYVEHSNEVWNGMFPQFEWNRRAANEEVRSGSSPLNEDGANNEDLWAVRRHIRRIYQTARIFEAAFGPGSLLTRIRPVHAWWHRQPEEFADSLHWLARTYGTPREFLYAIAQDSYFFGAGAPRGSTVPDILAEMRANSDAGAESTRRFHAIAREFGLRHTCYEGGPDNGGGGVDDVANRIRANRTREMASLIAYHLETNVFPNGPDAFQYFALSNAYSRYGCFGLTEDYRVRNTAKYKVIRELIGS